MWQQQKNKISQFYCAEMAAFHRCLSSNAEELSKNAIVTNRTTVPSRFPTDPDPNHLLRLIVSHQNNCITESFVLLETVFNGAYVFSRRLAWISHSLCSLTNILVSNLISFSSGIHQGSYFFVCFSATIYYFYTLIAEHQSIHPYKDRYRTGVQYFEDPDLI
jgi:hypothetical protein